MQPRPIITIFLHHSEIALHVITFTLQYLFVVVVSMVISDCINYKITPLHRINIYLSDVTHVTFVEIRFMHVFSCALNFSATCHLRKYFSS